MNMNDNPTANELAELLGAQDDRAGEHVLWIDEAGHVHMSLHAGPNVRVEYAPFEAGVGFVGADAALDRELVGDLLASLVEQWASAATAPPGIQMIDLDDPDGGGAGWTLSEVVTVDGQLLAGAPQQTLH